MDKIGNHITWLIHSLFAAWRYMDLSCIPLPAAGMPMKRAIDVFRVFFIFQTVSTIKNEFSFHTWRKYEYFCPCSLLMDCLGVSWMGHQVPGLVLGCGVPSSLSPPNQAGTLLSLLPLPSWNFVFPIRPVLGISCRLPAECNGFRSPFSVCPTSRETTGVLLLTALASQPIQHKVTVQLSLIKLGNRATAQSK